MASDNALRFDFVGRDRSVGKTMDGIADKGDGLGRKLGRAGKTLALAFGGAALGGIAAVGAALVDGTKAAARYEVLGKKTAAVIKSTGNLANISVKGVQALAGELESMSGVDEELIINSQNVLATFCLEESATALARGRGWVTHDQLRAGDEILAYDPERDEAYWERIDSMHRFQVSGELIRWKSRHIDVATTPHHRWWTVDNAGPLPYEPRFRTTEDISGKQVYVQIGGGAPAGFAGEATWSDDLVELLGWVHTEGWFPKWRSQAREVPARTCAVCETRPARGKNGPARCDECATAPKRAGQGRARLTEETARHYSVGFCQSETANPLEVKRIRGVVENLRSAGHRISERSYTAAYNDSTIVQWHFAGDLGRTVRELLPGKKLTQTLLEQLTAEQGALLLEVLIAGDGSVSDAGRTVFIQKDAGQLDVVASLAAMLGRRTARTSREDSITFQTVDRILGSNVHAEPEQYDGVVWCPHLRTGIFMARANGKTFWTGNTNIKNVGKNRIFDQATKSALDMSVALGVDLQGATIQIGKALNDPIKGITALSRVGVSFTQKQKDTIKALVESGKTMEAQKLILAELNKEFGGAAKAAGDTFTGKVERAKDAVGDLARDMGTLLLPALGGIADWVTTTGVPKLRQFSEWLTTKGVPKIQAGVKAAQDKLGGLTAKLDLSGLGKRLVAGAKAWGKDIVAGVRTGLETGDWSGLGMALGRKITDAIGGAASGLGQIASAIGKWAASVDWVNIGKAVGGQAFPFVVGFVNALFDPLFSGEFWSKHWKDVLLFAVNFIPFGKGGSLATRIAGKLGLDKGITGAVVRGLEGSVGKIGRAVIDMVTWVAKTFGRGFKSAFPEVGKAARGFIDGIALRFMYGRERLVKAIGSTVTGLIEGMGKRVGDVVVAAGRFAWRIIRALVKPFWETGKVFGEAFGFVFRTVGSELAGGVVKMARWGGRLVMGLARGMRSALGVPAHAMGGGVARILATVRNLPGRLFTKGSAAAQRLGAGIRSVARNFGSLLWNAGSNLMSGLASGIQSGWNNYVKPKLNWITDQIPKWKGPESKDKRLLTPSGRWIMGSLVKGLDPKPLWQHLSKVTDGIAGMGTGVGGYASTTTGAAAAATFAGSGSLPGGSSSAGIAQLHLHFHDSVIASRQAASDLVVDGLRMAQSQARLRVKVVV